MRLKRAFLWERIPDLERKQKGPAAIGGRALLCPYFYFTSSGEIVGHERQGLAIRDWGLAGWVGQ